MTNDVIERLDELYQRAIGLHLKNPIAEVLLSLQMEVDAHVPRIPRARSFKCESICTLIPRLEQVLITPTGNTENQKQGKEHDV